MAFTGGRNLHDTAQAEASPPVWRDRFLIALAISCCLLLLAVMAYRAWGETGGTNAYALVAESFLKGVPDVSTCFGVDCAVHDGKSYVIFPPFPGVLALPLVWLNGTGTAGFIILSLVLFTGSLALWNRIFNHLGLARSERFWLLIATGFASPLYYVALRGDGVWFFAQSSAFFLVTLALHEALVGRRLVTSGMAIGAALLCRQMSVFYVPLLFLIWLGNAEPLLRIDARRIRAALFLGLPVACGLVLYFAYNYWRFGDVLETGYRFIVMKSDPLASRLAAYGLWNEAYVAFNFFYFFFQGFHVEFAPPQQVAISGLDPAGTSILAASPWLLLLFFARCNRFAVLVLAMIAGFTALLMFYHSNGFSQYNVQRYALDWLPAALLVVAPALTARRLEWLRLLVVWGLVLNVATVVVLALTKSG